MHGSFLNVWSQMEPILRVKPQVKTKTSVKKILDAYCKQSHKEASNVKLFYGGTEVRHPIRFAGFDSPGQE